MSEENATQDTKTCTNCGLDKPLEAFQFIKTQKRYISQCKDCINKKRVERARANGVKPKELATDLARGVKRCSGCRQEKPLSDFYYSGGVYRSLCKECSRTKDAEKRRLKRVTLGVKTREELESEYKEKGFKLCSQCGKQKPLDDFKVLDTGRHSSICLECTKDHQKEYRANNKEKLHNKYKEYYEKNKDELIKYQKEYRTNNKEKIAERQRKYTANNAEKIRAYKAQYYENNKDYYRKKHREYYRENSEKIKEYQRNYAAENNELIYERRKKYREKNAEIIKEHKKEYSIKNRPKITAYYLNKRRTDPLFKLSTQVRGLIRMALISRGYPKNTHTYEIIGCDYNTLWEHLKDSWLKNYGTEWNGEEYHIDHIVPLATARTEQDVIRLCHYTNLQMLKPEDNLEKRDKLDWTIK